MSFNQIWITEFQVIRIKLKNFTPSHFPAFTKMVILGHFPEYRDKEVEQSVTLLFWSIYLWCSNILVNKMSSMTHSINELIHLEVIFKYFAINISIFFMFFLKTYQMSGTIRPSPSISTEVPDRSHSRAYYTFTFFFTSGVSLWL